MALLLDDDEDIQCLLSTPAAAALEQSTPLSAAQPNDPSAAGPGTFALKGGNGLDKMAALAFGTTKVMVVAGSPSRGQKRPRVTPTSADRTQPKLNAARTEAQSPPSGSTSPGYDASVSTPSATTHAGKPVTANAGVARSLALNVDDDAPPRAPVPAATPKAAPAAAAPKQMNLAVFFSRMALKKPE